MKTLLLLIPSLLFGQAISIDCGSDTDQYFTGGAAYSIATSGAIGDLTLRYGAFGYKIPAPPGLYHVTLSMRETGTVTASGQRLFTVKLNGQDTELDQFDLFAASGLNQLDRSFVAISNGFIKIDFTYTIRSAIISSIKIEPFITAQYIIPSDPKTVRVTNAVPVWFNDGYYVPRPAVQPDPTVQLLYTDVALYKNGARLSYENVNGFAPDFTIPSRVGQLKVLPIDGQRWPATDQIMVDYTAVFPPQFVPE